MKRRFLFMMIALAGLAAFSASEGQDPADRAAGLKTLLPWEVAASQGYRNLGARRCASSGCHGSVRPDATNDDRMRRDEYLVWLEEDPHQRGHAVLNGERSLSMFRNLGLSPDDEPPDDEQYWLVMQKCVACHAMPVGQAVADADCRQGTWEGVSCEMCHGPAEKWLKTHYRTDFISLTAEEKARKGLFNTNDAHQRARLCVACHVGDEQRQVNHDWIAAGHPALKFEFTAYLSMMPGHWKDSRDRKNARSPEDHKLELWLAGQQVAADASLSQLARRATAAAEGHADAVWPEFADVDCYSCHHDLGSPLSWRQVRGFGVDPQPALIRQVTLPASEWYLFMPARLAAGSDDEAGQDFQEEWQKLRRAMAAKIIPENEEIARLARTTRQKLDKWFSQRPLVADRQEMIAIMESSDGEQLVGNWDRAVQAYLVLRVITEESGKEKALKQIRDLLAFPVSTERRFDSPKEFGSVFKQVLEEILDFQKKLNEEREN
ncbi:MAG: multiheme c-type cytochrome [Pirellulaceae bacterium]